MLVSSKIRAILASKPHQPRHLDRYIKLLNHYKDNKIGDRHHICPKSKDLFPEYSNLTLHPWNLIRLPPKAHRLSHLIIAKIYPDSKEQNFCALKFFKKNENSKLYLSFYYNKNKEHSKRMLGEGNHFYGRKHTEESKSKMGWAAYDEETRKRVLNNKTYSEESLENMRKSGLMHCKNFFTKESIEKRSQTTKDNSKDPIKKKKKIDTYRSTFSKREELSCPHCDKSSKHHGNMRRYHFDNCRQKKSDKSNSSSPSSSSLT